MTDDSNLQTDPSNLFDGADCTESVAIGYCVVLMTIGDGGDIATVSTSKVGPRSSHDGTEGEVVMKLIIGMALAPFDRGDADLDPRRRCRVRSG